MSDSYKTAISKSKESQGLSLAKLPYEDNQSNFLLGEPSHRSEPTLFDLSFFSRTDGKIFRMPEIG